MKVRRSFPAPSVPQPVSEMLQRKEKKGSQVPVSKASLKAEQGAGGLNQSEK